jgi:hypothetical protein
MPGHGGGGVLALNVRLHFWNLRFLPHCNNEINSQTIFHKYAIVYSINVFEFVSLSDGQNFNLKYRSGNIQQRIKHMRY